MARTSTGSDPGTNGSARQKAPREPLPAGFGTIWTTVAVDLIGFGIVLPILPQYAEQFGASPTTVGLLVASFSIAQLICAPVLGRLSDRIGRKPVLIVSLFGTALGSLLTGLAGSVLLLFVARILDGASGASVSVAQAAAADLSPPRQRARLMGLLGAAFGVGFVAGPALGALGSLVGPKVPFLLAAAISFVNAVIAIKRLPETAPGRTAGVATTDAVVAATLDADHLRDAPALDGPGLVEPAHLDLTGAIDAIGVDLPTADRAGAGATGPVEGPDGAAGVAGVPGSPGATGADAGADAAADAVADADRPEGAVADVAAILRLVVVSFVAMVAFSGFEATFALLGERRFGFALAATGAVFTAIGIALVVVQVSVVGPVNDRLGEVATLRAGLVVNAVGLALLAVNGGWLTLVPSLALLVLGQGLLTPTLSSAVAGRAGEERGRWLGWHQSAGGLARVIGPIAAGALFEYAGVGVPYALGAVLALVALALVPAAAPDLSGRPERPT